MDASIRASRQKKPVSAPSDLPELCPYLGTALTGRRGTQIKPNDASIGGGLVAQLSERFRVIAEGGGDARQWLLQRRSGRSWVAASFCTTRDGLLLAIRQQCVAPNAFQRRFDYPDLDALAIAAIKALPARFEKGSI